MTRPALSLVSGSDLIAELRQLVPDRALTWSEARSIAERQAGLLLDLSSIAEPPVPQFVIPLCPASSSIGDRTGRRKRRPFVPRVIGAS
jgi:hypothetical protein